MTGHSRRRSQQPQITLAKGLAMGHMIQAQAANAIALRARQRFVLERLAATEGPVSRWSLVDLLSPGADDDAILRVYISRLRDFLGDDAIRTARGVGYQLTEKGRAAYARLVA